MGSVEEEITVAVTGFGPFRVQNPVNPSWEIANQLPPFLPPSSDPSISAVGNLPPVRILVHPEPIKVAYDTVRSLVPELWEGRKIDFMIHIGMAGGRRFYSVERRGHRDGYLMGDVDHKLLGDNERQKIEGDDWIWAGLPAEILSDLDIPDVWRRWRLALPDADVRISEDAGRYLCDFIYYSSLAHLTRKEEKRRVVFLHVPVDVDQTSIDKGVKITLELIRAMVHSERMAKVIDSGQWDNSVEPVFTTQSSEAYPLPSEP